MKQLDSRESAPDSAGLRQQELLLGSSELPDWRFSCTKHEMASVAQTITLF
jgi:hypothetical protein